MAEIISVKKIAPDTDKKGVSSSSNKIAPITRKNYSLTKILTYIAVIFLGIAPDMASSNLLLTKSFKHILV